MNWIQIESEVLIKEIKEESVEKRVLIFKYSPRSAISILMRGLFEREWLEGEMEMKVYFLDIMEHPSIANKIETEFNVPNSSPQVLIIENGKCVYSASNGGVDVKTIRRFSNLRAVK